MAEEKDLTWLNNLSPSDWRYLRQKLQEGMVRFPNHACCHYTKGASADAYPRIALTKEMMGRLEAAKLPYRKEGSGHTHRAVRWWCPSPPRRAYSEP